MVTVQWAGLQCARSTFLDLTVYSRGGALGEEQAARLCTSGPGQCGGTEQYPASSPKVSSASLLWSTTIVQAFPVPRHVTEGCRRA